MGERLASNMFMMPPRAMFDQLIRFFWPGMAGPASMAIGTGCCRGVGWGTAGDGGYGRGERRSLLVSYCLRLVYAKGLSERRGKRSNEPDTGSHSKEENKKWGEGHRVHPPRAVRVRFQS